jgi:natural product biosynthesis luciferase-like monooxygenase protein
MEIGLTFFSGNANRPKPLELYINASVWADSAGLSSIWTPERHFHSFGGAYPNPAVASAALAVKTNQIQLRSGSVVSPLHDAVSIAEQWAIVDNLSEGRVGLAFAQGWREKDFILRQDVYKDRQQLMWRQIEEIKQLWKGESIQVIDKNEQPQDLAIFPKPVRQDIPIWISTVGNPNTIKQAAKLGSGIFTHLVGQTVAQLAETIALYKKESKLNSSNKEPHVALLVHTFVADTDEQAKNIAIDPLRQYLKQWLNLDDKRNKTFEEQKNAELMLEVGVQRFLRGQSMIGSVDTCAKFIENMKSIGVNEIACLIDFGINENVVYSHLNKISDILRDCNINIRT